MTTNDGKSNTTLQPGVDAAKAAMKEGASPAEAAAAGADAIEAASKPATKPLTPEQQAAVERAVAGPKGVVDATSKSPLNLAAKAAQIAGAHNAAVTGKPAPAPANVKAPAPAATPAKPAAKPAVPLPSTARQRSSAATAPQTALIGGNSGTNDPFADMISKAAELGTAAGKGKNTQIQFHLMVLDAAFNKTIDLTTNKHGPDRDDALILSEAYVRAQNTATIFDPKAPNQRKATSLVRTCIKLGHYRPIKGNAGAGEPIRTVNALMTAWRDARNKINQSNGKSTKKLNDATNTLMAFARAQLKDDRLIPESSFPDFLFRKERELPDATELVSRARDALADLIKGDAAEGTAQDDSDEVKNAHQWLTVRLAKIAEEAAAQNAKAAPAPKTTP